MGIANFSVFNDNASDATIEMLNQRIDLFNNAQGMIQLSTVERKGDFFERAQWDMDDAHDTIDIYATNATRASTEINQIQQNDVKVQWVYGPIAWRGAEMAWINKSESEALAIVSQRMTDLSFQKMLNNSVGAMVSAVETNTAVTNDVSASANISQEALNSTYALMGDRQGSLVGNVMHSSAYNKLIGDALANSAQLFTAGNVQVIDIQGKQSIIADIPSLYVTGTPDKHKVLSLKEGAINCYDGGKLMTNLQVNNGKNMIEATFQANGNYMVSLDGYSWDETNGGKSPLDAELATGTNWDKYVRYDKNTGGVLLVGDATA
jgi:hypothetical protein